MRRRIKSDCCAADISVTDYEGDRRTEFYCNVCGTRCGLTDASDLAAGDIVKAVNKDFTLVVDYRRNSHSNLWYCRGINSPGCSGAPFPREDLEVVKYAD